MTTFNFLETLEKLPFYRRREVYNFLLFIYQKTLEEDLHGLAGEDVAALKAKRKDLLKQEAKFDAMQQLKKKEGL